MPRVEFTVESLSQVVRMQGLQAAQILISERAEALRADRARHQQGILAAKEAIKGIDSQLSQLESLLIGGVKKNQHSSQDGSDRLIAVSPQNPTRSSRPA